MTITELEKQIVKAIREDARIPLVSDVGHKIVIKCVKKLFEEYRDEKEYFLS